MYNPTGLKTGTTFYSDNAKWLIVAVWPSHVYVAEINDDDNCVMSFEGKISPVTFKNTPEGLAEFSNTH